MKQSSENLDKEIYKSINEDCDTPPPPRNKKPESTV